MSNLLDKALTDAIVKDIDINALAKKFKPVLQKQIEKELEAFIKNYEFDDYEDKLSTALDKLFIETVKNTLGIKDKPKGKK